MSDMNNEHEHLGEGLQTETFEFIVNTRAGKFYWKLTEHPKKVIAAGILAIILIGSFLPKLYKDTSAEAFIAEDNPAVVYRKKVEEIFGLADPVIVSVTSTNEDGIFTAEGLNAVGRLTRQISRLEGVDPERVTSLYTESNVIGDAAGMKAEPFFGAEVASDEEASAVFDAVSRFPLFMGSMVARDRSSTLIVAELLDSSYGNEVFHKILDLGESLNSDEIEIYVAGEGAVAEFLGEYIDADSRRLYPFVGLVIIVILYIAFRSVRGISVPLFVVLASVIISLGTMAGSGVPMYIITNALPVILIAIGVADGIHIVSEYYEAIALRPYAKKREPVVRAMSELWKAILFTSITDAAGFFALAAASFMPPMRAFGIYAGVGVIAACAFSLLIMPALLSLLKPKPSKAFKHHMVKDHDEHFDKFGVFMAWVGGWVVRFPKAILVISLLVSVAGIIGAQRLEINYARIDYFHEDEVIYQADKIINERFDGSNFIDVVIEAEEPDGLLNAAYLKKIEALQIYAETLPLVGGTISIADYVKQMNRAIWEDDDEQYILPDDSDLIAQYFLLFAATGDPEELSKVVDYDYRMANVRIAMTSGAYGDIKEVIEPLEIYLAQEFSDQGLKASVAGRANVTYHWIKGLSKSHFTGIIVALIAVWLCASISFRSLYAGLLAITPVVISILFIYAVMGVFNIWLGVGTSMFAAIGIGISVNFAIHTLHRTIELVRDYKEDLPLALTNLFPATGRALLFNFAAVFFGFGVLMTSQISALKDFGFLVAVATIVSFVASVTMLPAMLLVLKPKFLTPPESSQKKTDEMTVVSGWNRPEK